MTGFISCLFLTAAVCADAFAAGFACGTDRVRIPPVSALIITFLSTGSLAVSSLAGGLLKPFLAGRTASLLGGMILFALGLAGFRSKPAAEITRRANVREPEILSPSEAFVLGIALSLDNAAAGLGAGLDTGDLTVLSETVLIIFLSFAVGLSSLLLGSRLGNRAAASRGFLFSHSGSVLLIILALLKLV